MPLPRPFLDFSCSFFWGYFFFPFLPPCVFASLECGSAEMPGTNKSSLVSRARDEEENKQHDWAIGGTGCLDWESLCSWFHHHSTAKWREKKQHHEIYERQSPARQKGVPIRCTSQQAGKSTWPFFSSGRPGSKPAELELQESPDPESFAAAGALQGSLRGLSMHCGQCCEPAMLHAVYRLSQAIFPL